MEDSQLRVIFCKQLCQECYCNITMETCIVTKELEDNPLLPMALESVAIWIVPRPYRLHAHSE